MVLAVLGACALSVTVGIVAIGVRADDGVGGRDLSVSSTVRVGQGVRTTFGAVAVERVERRALRRPARGERLDVTVALINLGRAAVPVTAAGVAVRGADGLLQEGTLSPATPAAVTARDSVRATYSFALPAASRALQVELTTAGAVPRRIIVGLGASGDIPIVKEFNGPIHGH